MEYTREFKITIEIYEDTNKATYEKKKEFKRYSDAIEWLKKKSGE